MSSNVDAVVAEHDLQAGDVRALGLRQLVDVALEEDRCRAPASSVDAVDAVLEAAHLVHPAGAEQLAQQVDEARPADALAASTSPITPSANVPSSSSATSSIAPSSPGMPHAIAPPSNAGPAGHDAARMRCRLPTMQLGVGADVHDGDEPILVREVDREHARRGIGADVAADDRQPVDARLRMDRQQAAPAGLRSGWSSCACPPPSRSR